MKQLSWDEAVRALTTQIPVSKRWIHIWGVVETSMLLAEHHGISLEKAAWAALLHDCAKCFEPAELKRWMESDSLEIEKEDWEHPAIWHALVGARVAQERYGVEDPEILRAIQDHPTGNESMSDLDLLLYVADYVEPGRSFEAARVLRQRAWEQSLVQTAFEICQKKLAHLERQGRKAHTRSRLALQSLKQRR